MHISRIFGGVEFVFFSFLLFFFFFFLEGGRRGCWMGGLRGAEGLRGCREGV